MPRTPVTRRELIRAAAVTTISLPIARASEAMRSEAPAAGAGPRDAWRGLKVGVASYTLRKLQLDAAIAAIQRIGLHYVSIKDFHLPLASTREERAAVAARFKDAGIAPLSCGNISMENDAADVRRAFEYARDAGLPTIVCTPDPRSLPILDAMVKEFDIRLAIHNHGPEDKRFPSPYDVWKAVERYDLRIGLCIDVGHTARARVDPVEAIRRCRERLYDLHFKDIASTEPDGTTIEAGRGVLDLEAILRALLDIRYSHLVSFEYEKDEDDPLPGLAESVGYAKGLLTRMG